MPRYKLNIEYYGGDFYGWQKQGEHITVQSILENSIYKISGEQVTLFVAGRTDAGVHAICQTAHFDIQKELDHKMLAPALNYYSKPHRVSILNCTQVSENFHARFDAKKRHYLYRIVNRPQKVVLDIGRVWWVRHKLDEILMQEASKYLIGTHDFTSFRASQCQAKSPIRTLDKISFNVLSNNLAVNCSLGYNLDINIYFSAQSFLHHMVRNIVGTLVAIGLNKIGSDEIPEILKKKNRKFAGPMAPSDGLYFLRAEY